MHVTAALTQDESSLLRKARWGDPEAFEALYRLHATAIHTLAMRLTGNRAAAEDITQEAFLRMLQFLNGLRTDAPLRPWLKKVAANAAIDRLRREVRYAGPLGEEDWPDTAAGQADGAEAANLLQRLPAQARMLVWLHEMEGWTHAELGERFGQSPSWSKSIVARALEKLRRQMQQEDPTHEQP